MTIELSSDHYHKTARFLPSALLMLASNFFNRLFRVANAPSRMAPPRIVLVIPPLIFIAETSPLASGRAGSLCFTSFQLARCLGFVWRKVPRDGEGYKDEHHGRECGFITGKPVSYANIVLQTVHYRWWAINTPAWSPCSVVLMHSECLSITWRCDVARKAEQSADWDWKSKSAFFLPSFSFFSYHCAPLYYSKTISPLLEQCPILLNKYLTPLL